MKDAVSSPNVVRFGAYEVDLRSAELRKSGVRVRLTGQPFQILAILLEQQGELVTREELRKRLWPADTFVDFDRGLNAAINRVREALGDSAENPRFVETLPRRGYLCLSKISKSLSGWGLCFLYNSHRCSFLSRHFSPLYLRSFIRVLLSGSRTWLCATKSAFFSDPRENAPN